MNTKDGSTALKYPYVLFDLGGTLIYPEKDFSETLRPAVQAATETLRSLGLELDQQTFSEAYYDTIQRHYRRRDESNIEYPSDLVLIEALKTHNHYHVHPRDLHQALVALYTVTQTNWHVEPDAVPMLEALRASGRRLGIVSNAAFDEDVQMLVEQAGMRPYFDFVLTSAVVGIRKPNAIIYREALQKWNARPEQAAMVGDTLIADVGGANKLGIASIWIKRRVNAADCSDILTKYPPRAIVDTLAEIPALLNVLI